METNLRFAKMDREEVFLSIEINGTEEGRDKVVRYLDTWWSEWLTIYENKEIRGKEAWRSGR